MKIVLLPGDGIGPEVVAEAVKVLKASSARFKFTLEFDEALIGGCAYAATGEALPARTLDLCRQAQAVLLGAVGGPAWDHLPAEKRPEAGLLKIRKELSLFANIRPTLLYPELSFLSCLRPDLTAGGVDFAIVRELTGDVYFGRPAGLEVRSGLRHAFNNMIYNEEEIRRIAQVGFRLARSRRKKLCSVDKANVLEVSRLWRSVVNETAAGYPDVALSHMYVDNAAMQLVLDPVQFDVLLTGNLFGDILSDESAAVAGSLGLQASASLGDSSFGLYEPVHGSAPDIAGQNKANPVGCVLSAAMLLRFSLGQEQAASAIEQAVRDVLKSGRCTGDLARKQAGMEIVSCSALGDLIAQAV
ncbi:MAG: 3-isopropylmalate dehydrogenase [Deltaproteobacteria bacterium]|jgi:3-isopropylmalate dehydrogenase|nr:3-isopropylmalate dehydrogenase [Deltaproteobacteria bacterium]